MMKQSIAESQVPKEFKALLMDFTMNFLFDQPTDPIEYGITYFTKLKERKSISTFKPPEKASEPVVDFRKGKRPAVIGESFNPDEELNVTIHEKTKEQTSRLMASLKNVLLFRALEPEQLEIVVGGFVELKVSAGKYVIRQGDEGDFFYVVERGIYQAFIKSGDQSKLVKVYNHEGSFGELALMYNVPRAATIKAKSDGILWAMDRATFKKIVLHLVYKKREVYENFIACVPLLKSLRDYEKANLADALIPKTFKKGERIITQGESADGMYFIEEGIVRVTISDDRGEKEVNRLMKGDHFGELALVTHQPRAANVYAVTNLKLAFLDVDAFERLLGPCMNIIKRNIHEYENQLLSVFGDKANMINLRGVLKD